jgi:hypothetical protein
MASRMIERSWVSPITALSFLVVAATGLLMLLHVRLPAIKGLHQWLGVAFAVAALLHVVLNWRPLLACLRRRSAVVALGVTLGLCVLVALLAPADRDRPGGDRPGGNRHWGDYADSAEPTQARPR